MRKISIPLLCLLLALLCFASCGGTDETAPGTTEEATVDTAPAERGIFDAPAEPLTLVRGKETVYQLIRPDVTSEAVIGCYQQIHRFVQERVGVSLSGTTDWVKEGTDTTDYTEILIGNTSRPETKLVMAQIGHDDFAVALVGSKVVIAAHREARLLEAVTYFCEHSLTLRGNEDTAEVLYSGGVWQTGTGDFLFSPANPLSGYRIIFAAGNAEAENNAKFIRTKIKKAYGLELPIVTDAEPETECEIVIGPTSRAISAEGLKDLSSTEYRVLVRGKQLFVGSVGDAETLLAVTHFSDRFISAIYSDTMDFEKEFMMTDAVYSFNESNELAAGADIRVMSFNLLCELWDAKVPVEGRDKNVVATIRHFSPDVIGIQEVSDKWYESFDRLFDGDYVIPYRTNERGQTNFSTLAYNSKKVNMILGGTKVYSGGNDPRLRLATWCLFEKKDTGKRFIVMTTHWDLGKNAEFQQIHSDEMAELATSLKLRYQAPVITTGDYNVSESSPYYKNFVTITGFVEAKYAAAVINRASKSTHSLGAKPSTAPGESIDHIFGSTDAQFLYYNVLVDQIVLDSSDHCPIYADVRLP